MPEYFHLLVLTPRAPVFDGDVHGLRIPTETGQVGIHPRAEPMLLVVEPGLLILHTAAGAHFAATAGGLLESDRERCVIYTPFAVASEHDSAVIAELDRALSTPDGELAARRRLGELEHRIMREIRRREPIAHEAGP
ncbi:MAG: hypothetical protein ACU85V_04110 [Gammaproteobacteria bacterium]